MLYLSRVFPEYRLAPNPNTWEGDLFPTRETVDKWLKDNGYEWACMLNGYTEVWEKR